MHAELGHRHDVLSAFHEYVLWCLTQGDAGIRIKRQCLPSAAL